MEESPVDKILREKADGQADVRAGELASHQYWSAALPPLLDPIISEISTGLEESLGQAREGSRKHGANPSFTIVGQSQRGAVAIVKGVLTGHGDLVSDHSEALYSLSVTVEFGISAYASKERLVIDQNPHMFGSRRPGIPAEEIRRVILDSAAAGA